ncbi:TPA: hypothetical protein ACHV7O_005288, partial [Klebsiella quasipneumoniae]
TVRYKGRGGLAEPIKSLPAAPGFGATHFPCTIKHQLAPFQSYYGAIPFKLKVLIKPLMSCIHAMLRRAPGHSGVARRPNWILFSFYLVLNFIQLNAI